MSPFEKEVPEKTIDQLDRESGILKGLGKLGKEEMDEAALAREKRLTSWRRLFGEACTFPDKLAFKLDTSKLGCFRLAFANNGRYLAAGCTDEETIIKMYQVEDGELVNELRGHADLIHDLCWSDDDFHLLSASSDCTVKMWNFASLFSKDYEMTGFSASAAFNPGTAEFLSANMQHPSYVYCAKYHPEEKYPDRMFVVTACFDGKVRVWYLQL
jgi:WD40 repeat protein